MPNYRVANKWPWKSIALILGICVVVSLQLGVSGATDYLYLAFFSTFFLICNKSLENKGKKILIPAYAMTFGALLQLQEDKYILPIVLIASVEGFWKIFPRLKTALINMEFSPNGFGGYKESSNTMFSSRLFRKAVLGSVLLAMLAKNMFTQQMLSPELIFSILIIASYFPLKRFLESNQLVSPNLRILEEPMDFREERKNSIVFILILSFCFGAGDTTIYLLFTQYSLLLLGQKSINRLHSLMVFTIFSIQLLAFILIQSAEIENLYFYLIPPFVLMVYFFKAKHDEHQYAYS